MFYSQKFTIPSTRTKRLYSTTLAHKNQYFYFLKGDIKMETTAQEKLLQFIRNLTDEECEIIVSYLTKENTKEEV